MANSDDWEKRRQKIIGLGEKSAHKSYYPELKRRLEELERFRTLLDHSNDAIFLLEFPSKLIIDMNKSARNQLGCTTADGPPRVFDELVPPSVAAQIDEILSSGTPDQAGAKPIVTRLQAGTRTAVPVEIMIQHVRLGRQEYGILVARDISARLKMEEVLRQSEERYYNLFEKMPIGLFRATFDGKIVDANPALAEMLGYSRADLATLQLSDLYVDLQERARWRSLIGQTSVIRNFEIQFRRSDKTIIWVKATARAVYDAQGNIAFIEGSLEDITAHKQAQEELENYRRHLEQMIADRTSALAQANHQLQVLSQVKDEFVSNVSHELRTPITNLKLHQYLLARRPNEQPKHLAVLKRETTRLEQIIDSLLYLSRLDQNRVNWQPTLVDLNDVATQFVNDRKLLAQNHGLDLTATPYPALPGVNADVALLEQALSILLTNSLNYTPPGGRIKVSTRVRELDAQTWAGIVVEDTGPGIPPEDQVHLFERFFRGQVGRESGAPGTGLGLAIAHEIISKHQGQIEIISEGVPGKGTTFILWLPAAN